VTASRAPTPPGRLLFDGVGATATVLAGYMVFILS
jgi:hypothetical protein